MRRAILPLFILALIASAEAASTNGIGEERTIQLATGRFIEGRIIECVPASVKVQIGKGVLTYKLTELSTNEVARLPKDVRGFFDDAVFCRSNFEALCRITHEGSEQIQRADAEYQSYETNYVAGLKSRIASLEKENDDLRTRNEAAKAGHLLQLVDCSTKIVTELTDDVKFSWRAIIRNNGNEPKRGTLKVTFYDKDQFELDHDRAYDVLLPALSDETISGTAIMSKVNYRSIAKITATID